ncbi:hypothetical protein E2542_SST31014 [Spatholobus suberectus]|nr:hypothetical protein E2542_SST31014 [Spatholobus suberectus]
MVHITHKLSRKIQLSNQCDKTIYSYVSVESQEKELHKKSFYLQFKLDCNVNLLKKDSSRDKNLVFRSLKQVEPSKIKYWIRQEILATSKIFNFFMSILSNHVAIYIQTTPTSIRFCRCTFFSPRKFRILMVGVVGDTGDEILGMAEGFADGGRGFVRVKPLTVMTAEPPDHNDRKYMCSGRTPHYQKSFILV